MQKMMYELSVPAMTRGFAVLSGYLDKAKAHAEAGGVDPAELLGARLAPDMLPFSAQIQRASDKAKNGVGRLTGVAAPSFADTEASFDELRTRIARTVEFIGALTPAQFEGAEERRVELRFRGLSAEMSGFAYLTKLLLPDFYFHIATAHGILRHKGLAIGKADYLGPID